MAETNTAADTRDLRERFTADAMQYVISSTLPPYG